MEDSRTTRRKRLVSQGGDRLAFITGQSRSFRKDDYLTPPSPVAGAPNPQEAAVSSISASAPSEIRAVDQITSSEAVKDDRKETLPKETTPEILLKKEARSEPPKSEAGNEISKSTTSNESIKREEPDINRKVAEPSVAAVTRRVADAAAPPPRAVAPKPKLANFTPGQISSSVSASEDVRLLCAVVIALLVVFSYHGYSLGIGNIVSFRPLFLVLLTDATVVFARLLASHGDGGERREEEARAAASRDDWDIGKILEALMVLQKASSAAFMDCSVCAVIIICSIVAF